MDLYHGAFQLSRAISRDLKIAIAALKTLISFTIRAQMPIILLHILVISALDLVQYNMQYEQPFASHNSCGNSTGIYNSLYHGTQHACII